MDSWSFLEKAGVRFLWSFIHSSWGSSIRKSSVRSLANQVYLLKDELNSYRILVIYGQKSQIYRAAKNKGMFKILTAHNALNNFECLVI